MKNAKEIVDLLVAINPTKLGSREQARGLASELAGVPVNPYDAPDLVSVLESRATALRREDGIAHAGVAESIERAEFDLLERIGHMEETLSRVNQND